MGFVEKLNGGCGGRAGGGRGGGGIVLFIGVVDEWDGIG